VILQDLPDCLSLSPPVCIGHRNIRGHPQGHGESDLIDQAGSNLIHSGGPIRTRHIGFQIYSTEEQGIIESSLLLRGQGDGDGDVAHRVRCRLVLPYPTGNPPPNPAGGGHLLNCPALPPGCHQMR